MRVAGGIIGRREIRVPKGIRPTQDKVRAAIFNSLGEAVVGARVLDLFAGSGALGIEAWSRGAACVWWVEADRRVLTVLKENVAVLCRGGGVTEVRQADALGFLKKSWTDAPFGLILADPPYDREGERRWLERVLLGLEESGILAPGGLLVFEQSAAEDAAERRGWELVRDRKYGDTRVIMYKRMS